MVAACVMTFEARDRAAKFMSNQLKIMGGGGGTMSGHRGHGRQTPNTAGYLSRGDSGRSNYMQNLCDAGRHKMNKSPSAPNLAAMNRGPGSVMTGISNRLPLRHKHTVHAILSPGGGRALLSPHTLRRQAMSMDTQDYNPFFSPPRSRHSSSGMLTYNNNNNNNNNNIISSNNNNNINCINNNNNKQGSCNVSRESVNDPRARGSRGSMVLDLHVPNECSVTMRVRDRSRRSDTARRHLLRRQTPVELDDSIIAYASSVAANTAAVSEQKRQRAKRCTRSATCDVPHVVKSKRRRQDSSCSDVVAHRRRSGSPVCVGTGCVNSSSSGGWRSSANDVVDTIEWSRTAGRGSVSAVSSPQRVTAAECSLRQTPVHLQSTSTIQGNANGKMSLSRTCSDIMSIDKSFEESNYSSS